jgi:hypothetical protein
VPFWSSSQRASTPIPLSFAYSTIKDLKADDPELLLKLKRNASTFVANWVRYRDESMTEEEKRHKCQQIARREQEKEEEFERLIENTCRKSTGLFVMPVSETPSSNLKAGTWPNMHRFRRRKFREQHRYRKDRRLEKLHDSFHDFDMRTTSYECRWR